MLPEWLRERAATLRQWRSQARLAALGLAWRAERFAGDEWVFDALDWGDRPDHAPGLEGWWRHDKHMWSWETSQRVKAVNWRCDLYRNFVARLSRRYHTAYIEDCNWKDIGRVLPAEEAVEDQAARRYRQVAAPGKLSQTITQRFAEAVRVNPAYTTQTCHMCESCGAVWDQDCNAARNLLASGQVVADSREPLEVV